MQMSERGPGDRPRSGRPLVEVMEPTDLRDGHHAPELGRMHLAWLGTVVVKRLVWPRSVVVTDVCVQRRQTCSVGGSPTGATARRPVAWMAGWRETKTLKPIDEARSL